MPKKTILIVDDDEEFLEELKEMLASKGYTVEALNKSTRVLKKAAELKPDLIMLDLKMDEQSGVGVANELGKDPKTSHIPILVMTAFFTEDEHDWEHQFMKKRFKAERRMEKPLDPDELFRKIGSALK